MQLFKYTLSALALAACALAGRPSKLGIDVTYLPEACPAKAKTGDSIKVHYVSMLVVFDERT